MSTSHKKITSKKSVPKKTVGAYSYELQQKPDEKINPIDLQREIHRGNSNDDSFENQVIVAINRGKNYYKGNFFVVVLFKKERLLKGVIRQYFFHRESCPTPEYDQVVYHYFPKDQKLEFIWVVPDKQSVIDFCLIGKDLPAEQQQLVQFARDFNSGELDKKSDRLNLNIISNK